MKIGIIGAGMIGGTLVRRWTRLGHEVFIANSRGPETLRELAAETGAKAVTRAEAARAGEVVVLTIPQKAVLDLPKDLFANVPKDVVVIDTGNYYPIRDGQLEELDGGQVESEWVASKIGRPVVKVFNNIYFKSLLEKGTAKGTPGRIALPVAGIRPRPGRRCSSSWTNSVSTPSMLGASRNPGGSSPAPRATPTTSTRRA